MTLCFNQNQMTLCKSQDLAYRNKSTRDDSLLKPVNKAERLTWTGTHLQAADQVKQDTLFVVWIVVLFYFLLWWIANYTLTFVDYCCLSNSITPVTISYILCVEVHILLPPSPGELNEIKKKVVDRKIYSDYHESFIFINFKFKKS